MQLHPVGVLRRALSSLALGLVLAWIGVGISVGSLHAQGATGKIEGHIRDQAGAPITAAQVVVAGTSVVAATNGQGYYFINNVPAGTVTLRSAYVGYRPVAVTGLKVLGGQTITQDFAMESAPVEIAPIEIVAENVLVPRDAITTRQRVDGELTEKLPVDRLNAVLALQPGVVASASGNTLEIRGGRDNESATYVDGVPITGGIRPSTVAGVGMSAVGGASLGGIGVPNTTLSVGTNAITEATVTTGGQGAAFGNAQSGIISIETRGGGTGYAGSIAYETDEPFGVNHSLGFNRVEGSFGGPIFKNLTFNVSGTLEGQKSVISGLGATSAPIFVQAGIDTTYAIPSALNSPTADTTMVDVYNYAVARGNCADFSGSANPGIASNYGVSCQGIRTPGSAATLYQTQGKLSYSYGLGSRISLSLLGSRNQGRVFNYSNLNDAQANSGFNNRSRALILNLTQNLTHSTERALALDASFSLQQDRAIVSPLTSQSEQDSRSPFGGFLIKPLKFLYDFNSFPVDAALIANYRANNTSARILPYDLNNIGQYAPVNQYRTNPYANFSNSLYYTFAQTGGPFNTALALFKENRALGRANLDWQLDRYNRVKVGGEFTHYNITQFSSALSTLFGSNMYLEKPIRYNGYVEDRLDLGDVVLVGGLRYDAYDSRATRTMLLDTVSTSGTFGQYLDFPRVSSYGVNGSFNGQPLQLLQRDRAHTYLSPHMQVSFPVSERTNFRLSYAHQVQAPDFSLVYGGINTDLSVTNTNNAFGSDLDFGKTVTFEFGVRHSFSPDMVFDIAAYNKDKLSDATVRLISRFDPASHQNTDLRVLTNADFGNTRGVDIRFDRRIGQVFNGVLSYTYEQAKNTGSDPFTYLNFGSRVLTGISGTKAPPAQGILPTSTSRPHNFAGAFSMTIPQDWHQGSAFGTVLKNVSAFATFRYASGTAYTPCPGQDTGNSDVLSGLVCNKDNAGNVNGSRLPSFKQFDLRVTKGFALAGLDLTAYVDARNLLNLRNVLTVFTTTRDVTNRASQAQYFAADSQDFAQEATNNHALLADGSVDLTFGVSGNPNPKASCGVWLTQGGLPAAPNCLSLIRAEERFGNGDHIFSVAEQARASDALYQTARGLNVLTGPPRLVRLGMELSF
ncbi:MAG: TonB-dependent receptor [Gemmatimonadota bacterium]